MTIYEIDSRIQEFMNAMVDPETGELLEDLDFSELEALQMARDEKVANCLLAYKNLNAEAAAIRAEMANLEKRAKRLENRANGFYNYADYCLAGSEFNDPRVAAKYTQSKTTEVSADFLEWAALNGRQDLIRQKPAPAPEPNKTAIAKAIKAGEDLKGKAWQEPHRKLKVE